MHINFAPFKSRFRIVGIMHHKVIKMMPHGHCTCLQLICTSQFLMFTEQLPFYVAWLHSLYYYFGRGLLERTQLDLDLICKAH